MPLMEASQLLTDETGAIKMYVFMCVCVVVRVCIVGMEVSTYCSRALSCTFNFRKQRKDL